MATLLFTMHHEASASKRITSMALVNSRNSQSLLFTTAASHTISIYKEVGAGDWQRAFVVGGPRGCQDGPLDQCLFWFPCPERRTVRTHDSRPIIPGEDGAVF